jgi:hypothetical protein
MVVALGLVGCSSKESASRRVYEDACSMATQDKGMCSCMYDLLRTEYTAEALASAAQDVNPPNKEWQLAMARVTLVCLRR